MDFPNDRKQSELLPRAGDSETDIQRVIVENRRSHQLRPNRESRRFVILQRLAPASLPRPGRQPCRANQLVNRVVQKASFRSPVFIGFFAPISEIRAGPLPTVF
jgi:hypothetical protein